MWEGVVDHFYSYSRTFMLVHNWHIIVHGWGACTLAQFRNQGLDAQQAVGWCSGKWAAESAPRGHDDSSKSPSPAFPPPNFKSCISVCSIIVQLPCIYVPRLLIPSSQGFAAYYLRSPILLVLKDIFPLWVLRYMYLSFHLYTQLTTSTLLPSSNNRFQLHFGAQRA